MYVCIYACMYVCMYVFYLCLNVNETDTSGLYCCISNSCTTKNELKPIKCIFEYSAACLSASFEIFPGLIPFGSLWHAETCLH